MRTYALIILLLAARPVWGQAADAGSAAAGEARPISAAILDYDIRMPGDKELGSQIAEILTARLSVEEAIRLVERAQLGKIIDEQKLKLVGIVDQDQAVKVGKLVGAKLMVMGKGFVMDKKLIIVTKVVGVETGLVKGTFRSVELSKPLSEAVLMLSEDIAGLIKKHAAALLPEGSRLPDPVAEIRKLLGDRAAATVAVIVPEEHITRRPERPPVAPDPAVETEIKRTLVACGFGVVDVGRNDLADWAKGLFRGKDQPWPAALKNADVVIVGEAFSEFAARTGDLVTCTGRAEVNVIDRHTGKILVAERETRRAVDLAESTAGKTALQTCGRHISIAVGRALAAYRPPKPGKAAAAPAGKD